MANPIFAVELVDKIIGCVYDNADIRTLRASSLVCRQWRAICIPYLFRKVTIFTETSLEKFVFFASDDPTVAHHVHTLTIHPRVEGDLIRPSSWIAKVPSALTPILDNLQAIEFIRLFELGEYMNADFIIEFSNFTLVDTLKFQLCSMDVPLVQALIAALPRLRTLVIFSISPIFSDAVANLPYLRSPRLVNVDLYFSPTYPDAMRLFLPWIETTETRETIRSFSATVCLTDSAVIGQFITCAASHIEELKLELEVFLGYPDESEREFPIHRIISVLIYYSGIKAHLDIHQCRNLQSLEIYDENPVSAAILGFLAEASSPPLRTIYLPFRWHTPGSNQFPDFSLIDAALSSRAFYQRW